MKRIVWLMVLVAGQVFAQDDFRALLERIEQAQRGADSFVAKMTMASYDGAVRTGEATLELFIRGMETSIARYLAPPTDRGKAFLQRGQNYWVYFPRTRQSVRISPRQRLFGEASIGDVVRPPLLSTYEVQLVSNTGREQVFELRARATTAPYQLIFLWWDVDRERIVKENFHSRAGVLLKQAWFLEHRRVRNYWFATKVKIQSALNTNRRTVLEIVDLRERELSESIFYPEALDFLPFAYR